MSQENLNDKKDSDKFLYKPLVITYFVSIFPIMGLILAILSPKLKKEEKFINITLAIFLIYLYGYFILRAIKS